MSRKTFLGVEIRDWKDYAIQVSLILLSLFIATRVDRCQESGKAEAKRRDYLEAILFDLRDEHESNTMNLVDCEQDIEGLMRALELSRYPESDSLDRSVRRMVRVLARGVFRTFSPTTYDIMVQTGDINLIRNLELRSDLSGVFSFRNTVIKEDLAAWDKATIAGTEKMGRYINLACVFRAKDYTPCIIDPEAFVNSPLNEISLLLRQAQLRAFHLGSAVRMYPPVIEAVEKELGIN